MIAQLSPLPLAAAVVPLKAAVGELVLELLELVLPPIALENPRSPRDSCLPQVLTGHLQSAVFYWLMKLKYLRTGELKALRQKHKSPGFDEFMQRAFRGVSGSACTRM